MISILSELQAQWFFGVLITLMLFYLRRQTKNKDIHNQKMILSMEKLTDKSFNMAKKLSVEQVKMNELERRCFSLSQDVTSSKKECDKKIHTLEVKMYKIRNEILHTRENIRQEHNNFLSKLDKKIENIYIFLTQHEKSK